MQVSANADDIVRPNIDLLSFFSNRWNSRFTSAANNFYNEMGLVSISIVAFTSKTGNMVVEM